MSMCHEQLLWLQEEAPGDRERSLNQASKRQHCFRNQQQCIYTPDLGFYKVDESWLREAHVKYKYRFAIHKY